MMEAGKLYSLDILTSRKNKSLNLHNYSCDSLSLLICIISVDHND